MSSEEMIEKDHGFGAPLAIRGAARDLFVRYKPLLRQELVVVQAQYTPQLFYSSVLKNFYVVYTLADNFSRLLQIHPFLETSGYSRRDCRPNRSN
jgi:hypothetical protein